MPGEERLDLPCSVRSMQGNDIAVVVICFAVTVWRRWSSRCGNATRGRGTRRSGPGEEEREAAGGRGDAEVVDVMAEGRSTGELFP